MIRGLLFLFLGMLWVCRVEAGNPSMTGSFTKVNPSLIGGELTGAYLFHPRPARAFWVGPRAGLLWAGGNSSNRFESIFGVDSTLWLVNAFGLGAALDGLISDHPFHIRVNPYLDVRFLRYGEEGAWSFRVGVPYDTRYQWGIQLGISLQTSGVPNIGLLKDGV